MPTSPTKSSFATPSRTSTFSSSNNNTTTDANPFNNNDFSAFEHVSPTKALFQSRLNNDITSLTAWLEILHSPGPIPKTLLAWRDEVHQASQFNVGVLGPGAIPSAFPSLGGGGGEGAHADDGSKILEALKALKQANLLADHLQSLLHEAKVEELEEVEQRNATVLRQRDGKVPSRVCIDHIYTSLAGDAKVAVDELGTAAVLLKIPLGNESRGHGELDVEEENRSALSSLYSRRILQEAHRGLVLDEQVEKLRELLQYMWSSSSGSQSGQYSKGQNNGSRVKTAGLPNVVEDTSSIDQFHKDEQRQAETAGFLRDTKQINLKILEYQDRVTGLHRQLARLRAESISLTDILNARKQVEERSRNIEELESRLRAFHGLSPDLTASRNEIKRSAIELEQFRRKREELFGRISNVER